MRLTFFDEEEETTTTTVTRRRRTRPQTEEDSTDESETADASDTRLTVLEKSIAELASKLESNSKPNNEPIIGEKAVETVDKIMTPQEGNKDA